jgi:hypothetical protein
MGVTDGPQEERLVWSRHDRSYSGRALTFVPEFAEPAEDEGKPAKNQEADCYYADRNFEHH